MPLDMADGVFWVASYGGGNVGKRVEEGGF